MIQLEKQKAFSYSENNINQNLINDQNSKLNSEFNDENQDYSFYFLNYIFL
jgi:hypothetical protein